jgi:hypothetical protein
MADFWDTIERHPALRALLLLGGLAGGLQATGWLYDKALTAASNLPRLKEVSAQENDAPGIGFRELQIELRRLRCYSGPIDGRWGEQSRLAFTEFLEATDQIDSVETPTPLATAFGLFQRAPDEVCASSHPMNQGSALRRLSLSNAAYRSRCRSQIFWLPIWEETAECRELKLVRDEAARKVESMGIQPEAP